MRIGYLWESQKEIDNWEDQDVGGWKILKWILDRYDGMVWCGVDWINMAQEGSCEHGIEPLGSIECWEVLELLHN
jgi:hypothetical protein